MKKTKRVAIRLDENDYDYIIAINSNISKALREILNDHRYIKRDGEPSKEGNIAGRRSSR